MKEIVFATRYDALGMDRPDPETVCEGLCEGVGFFPVKEDDSMYHDRWLVEHKKAHSIKACTVEFLRLAIRLKFKRAVKAFKETRECDGWHFIKCPDCGGTGKRK